MKIAIDYGTRFCIRLLTHSLKVFRSEVHLPKTTSLSCKTVRLYDHDRQKMIIRLMREKSELLRLNSWPWQREFRNRHKEINQQLEALGVY